VRGARTKITENATWFVNGDVTQERGERIYATSSTFTSDDRPEPAYHFKADKIMIIRNRVLVGRPAYLYFKNVPVMALPFIVQDLERGRRSGFLIPQFEINDIIRTRSGNSARGTGREISNIGYYWAINQYLGATVTGRWRSGTYTALGGDLDFNFRRRFLNGSIAFENFWQDEGDARMNLNGSARWDPNERTNLALSLDYARSTAFERERTVDPFRQSQDISSSLSLTRKLDWGNLTVNAERRQSLANDDVTFTPRFNLSVNPITLFPGPSDGGSFYNNAVLSISLNGSRNTTTAGNALARRIQGTETADVGGGVGITLGNLGLSTNASYQMQGRDALAAIDSAQADVDAAPGRLGELPGLRNERVRMGVSASYQQTLLASTRISPTIGFDREYVRRDSTGSREAFPDSLRDTYGEFIGGPARLNGGATLNTDLYGFFPGFGNYTAIRHHVKPILTWTYSPSVQVRDTAEARRQRQVFGRLVGGTTNRIQLSVDQTFEAKLRDPEPVRGDSMADSAQSAGNAARPAQARKITLLSINTSAVTYSFEDLDTLGTRFQQEEITNSLRSDLLGGLQFSVTHDLFDDRLENGGVRRGRFSPFLTSFNTGFTLGQNSALFRWLGFGRATEEERRPERGQTPDSAGVAPAAPLGGANFTGNNQQAGGGPWSLTVNYSLARTRRSAGDTIPGFFDPGNQEVSGGLSFSPTRNWAVNWRTGYSITDRKFHTHVINLKRDLYRWQANFDYIVAPNGNTSFSFSVHLIDLPDLKADYNERNLGTDRPERTNQ
ncbi:MAG TPA: putative LPS assembly protein LptD, partial [Longimicrobium sp.]|nr:putative LPS assembly protein LptD [Longimicrobium sp.]